VFAERLPTAVVGYVAIHYQILVIAECLPTVAVGYANLLIRRNP